MSLTDSHAAVFEDQRGLLLGASYRMLGSVSDAEDIVQETWLRWTRADAATIDSPRSWLLTVASRLCLDRLKSARVQREQYYGTWLPEPFLEEKKTMPTTQLDESVSIALLLVLEKLSPTERAAFLLHEVFGYTFAEIAEMIEESEVNCRKIVSRARVRVRAEKPRFSTNAHEHEELIQRFLQACRVGEMQPLMDLFGESVAFYSDGGGKVSAVPTVLTDPAVIARFFIGITKQLCSQNFEVRPTTFNGAPGVLFYVNGEISSATTIEVKDGAITAIFAHRNPDKLRLFS